MPRIVIYVRGGVVQDYVADMRGMKILVVDYDNEEAGDQRGTFVQVPYDAKQVMQMSPKEWEQEKQENEAFNAAWDEYIAKKKED